MQLLIDVQVEERLPTDYVGRYGKLTRLIGIAFLRDGSEKNVMGKLNRYEAEQHRIWLLVNCRSAHW